MYEEIRKPKMLQDVPRMLIRPLPVIYYTNKFVTGKVPVNVMKLYKANISYLDLALELTSQTIDNIAFKKLSLPLKNPGKAISTEQIEKIQSFSLELAAICTKLKSDLRKKSSEIKTKLMKLYAEQIDPMKILIISMDQDMENVQKVRGILKGFCQYSVDCCRSDALVLSQKLVFADFVLFSSTTSPEIHKHIKKIETYCLPGLATVPFDKLSNNPEGSIRHAAQLLRTGFPVLFRMFTPLRMFTTIEKTYLTYHLS